MSGPDALALREIDVSGFKEMEFQYGMVHTMGGKLTKPQAMITRKVGPKGSMFAQVNVKQRWLISAATGQTTYCKNMFGSACLLRLLHDTVETICNGDDQAQAAEVAEEGGEEYDPMNEVECAEETGPAAKQTRGCGNKRARYYQNNAKGRIVARDFPKFPPEIVAGCKEKRSIQLYVATRKEVWLRLEDVPWAVMYLYLQASLKGVPLVAPDSVGPGGSEESSGQ